MTAFEPCPSRIRTGEVILATTSPENYPVGRSCYLTIAMLLSESLPVKVQVFDVRGRLVARLLDEQLPQGEHEVTWTGCLDSGGEAPSGKYFVRIHKGSEVEVLQATLVR